MVQVVVELTLLLVDQVIHLQLVHLKVIMVEEELLLMVLVVVVEPQQSVELELVQQQVGQVVRVQHPVFQQVQ